MQLTFLCYELTQASKIMLHRAPMASVADQTAADTGLGGGGGGGGGGGTGGGVARGGCVARGGASRPGEGAGGGHPFSPAREYSASSSIGVWGFA